jgi:hypothetical protein
MDKSPKNLMGELASPGTPSYQNFFLNIKRGILEEIQRNDAALETKLTLEITKLNHII